MLTAKILQVIYSGWTWFSLRTRIGICLILAIIALFAYLYYQKSLEQAESKKQLQQWLETKSQEDLQRINKAKTEADSKQTNVNKLLENVNRIREANSNRIINQSDLERILREK